VGQWFGHPFTRSPFGDVNSGTGWGLCPSKPALIGETGANGTIARSATRSAATNWEFPELVPRQTFTLAQDYENAFNNGWQGVMGWTSNRVDNYGTPIGPNPTGSLMLTEVSAASNAFRNARPHLVFPNITSSPGGDWVWCLSEATPADLVTAHNNQNVVLSTWGGTTAGTTGTLISLSPSGALQITRRGTTATNGAFFTFARAGMNISSNTYRIVISGNVADAPASAMFRAEGITTAGGSQGLGGTIHGAPLTNGNFNVDFTIGPAGSGANVTHSLAGLRLITNADGADRDITINTLRVTRLSDEPTPTPTPSPTPTPTPSGQLTPTEITSIRYEFTVAGAAGGTNLTFTVQEEGWTEHVRPIPSGNGARNVTADFSNGTMGLRNPGFVNVIAGNNATLTLSRIIVNGDIELLFTPPRVLTVGTQGTNGLPNVWQGLPNGFVLAASADGTATLALDFDAELFRLYTNQVSQGPIMTTSRSRDYVASMGMGWNLGNTLDAPGGTNLTNWETNWGNPRATRELIKSIKDRGYTHIRIPFTIGTGNRVINHPAPVNTPAGSLRYEINSQWLARYREVVQWAYDEGLYVMVNIHHDSHLWLGRSASNWTNADLNAWQLRRFRDHWTQLAYTFADFGDRVMFETLNEPHFFPDSRDNNPPPTPIENEMLRIINQSAYDIIRATPGNETRIIAMPTIWTAYSSNHSRPIRDFIRTLNDENVIATVHYYSEWLFSDNLGIMIFDEPIGGGSSARTAAENFFKTIENYFLSEGIGVNIGEWGLLAYDQGNHHLQTGEEIKYYEYMHHLARQFGASLTFWDNGSGIYRHGSAGDGYPWRVPRIGEIMEASMRGRSSHATGLDTIYLYQPAAADIQIPLTLNGNTFVGIRGLTLGTDYTYNAGVVTLRRDFVNSRFNNFSGFGTFATLIFEFNNGADWHQFLVKHGVPQFTATASGTRSAGITIPVNYNGSVVRRVRASQAGSPHPNNRVGGDHASWWLFLHRGPAFGIDNPATHFRVGGGFFNSSVASGQFTMIIDFFDGQTVELTLNSAGTAGSSVVTVADIKYSLTIPVSGNHTVTFSANGGANLSATSRTVANNAALGEMPSVNRAGQRFIGWFDTSATTGGTRYHADSQITGSITLHARWRANPANFMLGDTLNHGRVTTASATRIARWLIEDERILLDGASSTQLLAADMNGDGYVDIRDLVLLARLLVGLETN
jgi:endoglucanase